MSLMNLLQQAQGGQGLGQLASQFGLDESKATELSQLLAHPSAPPQSRKPNPVACKTCSAR